MVRLVGGGVAVVGGGDVVAALQAVGIAVGLLAERVVVASVSASAATAVLGLDVAAVVVRGVGAGA